MLPGKVYLETSLLRGLPFDLQDANFQVFQELCEKYSVPLATTRLCVDELVQHRKEQLQEWIRKTENPPKWLGPQLGNPVTIQWTRKRDDLLQEIEQAVPRVLQSQGIEMIENAQIEQAKLLDMAVKKVPPFKDRGRGYRDSVILLTMLDTNVTGEVERVAS